MERKKESRQIPKISSTTIDPDVLARINEKIARAHEQNEKPYVYHGPKTSSGTATVKYSIITR